MDVPDAIESVEQLEELLSRPDPGEIEDLAELGGDLLVLGAGGKMGPTLARMARRALDARGARHAVIAVSRFSSAETRRGLEAAGVRTVSCDLLDRDALARLPDAAAVLFLAGRKFGTSGAADLTWALNAALPAFVAERWAGVPTVAFSSGNVYPLTAVASGGAREETPPAPEGEYAWSVLARERIFEHAARSRNTPVLIFRLNYACELRYGVLVDLALRVRDGIPIDLRMGHVNVIWQGDANAAALRALRLAAVPAARLNVTGAEVLSVRALAEGLGKRMGIAPRFDGEEAPDALLSDAARAHARFGPPAVSMERLLDWVAAWVLRDGPILDRPTHYEVRDGQF